MGEQKRGCGWREVHKLYLVGGFLSVPCDRLPLRIGACPTCGAGLHFTRSMTQIIPLKIFGVHSECKDEHRPCYVCDPTEKPAYVMMVGEKFYTPQSFLVEAQLQGVSKKVPFIPKDMKLGETIVYLAHNKACEIPDDAPDTPNVLKEADAILQTRMVDTPKMKKTLGIFSAFIPQRVEMLFYESEITDKLKEKMEKRGVTIVAIPDGAIEHMSKKQQRKIAKKERQLKQELKRKATKKKTGKVPKQVKVVQHYRKYDGAIACGETSARINFTSTPKGVTCKNCLHWIAANGIQKPII